MKKRVVVLVTLAVAMASLAIAGLGLVPASRGYCVEARFSTAPDNDEALERWLRTQPGVVEHTVHVARTPTTPPKLVLTFIMVQNCWLKPSFPDLKSIAIELGYAIDRDGFRDQDRNN
jgi:hypothetical protein